MEYKYIDMHCHTTASDGCLGPEELIDYAIEKGLSGIAITDHDTISGVIRAQNYSKDIDNFYFIPGVEISTEFLKEEVHILGYGIDPVYGELNELLYEMKINRESRTVKMVEKLNHLGFDITYDEVRSIAEGVVGRPHIGQVLIEKGYVKDMQEVFKNYLKLGGAAYVPRYKITPAEAISIIKKAGGIPVLAHPGYIKKKEILEKIISFGIDGIEVYYPTHSENQIEQFYKLASDNDLIATGGSDFHSKPNKTNSRYDLGYSKVSIDKISKILDLL